MGVGRDGGRGRESPKKNLRRKFEAHWILIIVVAALDTRPIAVAAAGLESGANDPIPTNHHHIRIGRTEESYLAVPRPVQVVTGDLTAEQ